MSRAALVVCLSLALAAPAAAQSTRIEAIGNEQAVKSKKLKAEQAGDAEMVIKRITSAIGKTPEGPYPWFGSIFPGGFFAAGLGYGRSTPRGGRINFVGGVSAKAYKLLAGEYAPRELIGGRLHTSIGIEWIDAGGVTFHGLGQGSSNDVATYGYQPTTARAAATFKVAPWLKLNGGYHLLHTVTDRGDGIYPRFTVAETPGLDQSLVYNVPNFGVTIDTRPSPGYSTRGAMIRGSWARYSERKDRPYSFDSAEYEAGVLVPLLREQFGFMFHALATMTTPDAGSRVPIMLAPDVGSGSTVRGFPNRRFQDNGRLVLTGEYRWRPSRYVDMAVFLDGGKVAPAWKAFRDVGFETGWGIGMRIHGPTFTVMRVELASTRNGLNLVVAATPAF